MGRNLLSTTGLVQKLIDDLKPLFEMLSPRDRRIAEKYKKDILQQRVAIANATDLLPLEAAFVIILLEEHKRIYHDFNDLYQQVEELRRVIAELKQEA